MIHCDDVEAVLQRLPNHVCYIVEYLIRFVARLKLEGDQLSTLMMRFVAALTHQSVVIGGINFPDVKLNFPKLRGGTADSTLKFMLRLLDVIENEPSHNEVEVNEFRQKFRNHHSESVKMEIDDTNSMQVNSTSRQSSAATTSNPVQTVATIT